MEQSKVTRKQIISNMCFICGIKNDAGLKIRFYETENNEVVCKFVARDEHQSYPGRLHGGIASTVLDELIGRTIQLIEPNAWGVTCDLSIKYKKPVPLNVELIGKARYTKYSHGLLFAEGEIYLPDGNVAVTASGRYLKMPLDKILNEGGKNDHDEMFIIENEQDPEYI